MVFRTNYLVRPSEIPQAIAAEGLGVWLCSYGGSGTNMLADYLESKSLVVRTPVWHQLICHHSAPIDVVSETKAIYLFGDPVAAFKSMKRRGKDFFEVNLRKLNNQVRMTFSDQRLVRSMLRQFAQWTGRNHTNLPILIVNYEHIFDEGKHAIAEFLGIDVADFPKKTPRCSHGYTFPGEEELFAGYAAEIDRVLSFPSHLLRRPSPRKMNQRLSSLVTPRRDGQTHRHAVLGLLPTIWRLLGKPSRS